MYRKHNNEEKLHLVQNISNSVNISVNKYISHNH